MSFSSLWIGVSGLTAAQRQMEVAANNVSNVNTPGYTRQRVELTPGRPTVQTLGAAASAMRGTGVSIADVVRMRDTVADSSYRSTSAEVGSWEAKSSVLDRAQQILGPVDDGVHGALSAFWAAWDDLALRPDDDAGRAAVIDAGDGLARQIRAGATGLDQLRGEAAASMHGDVETVNRLATEVAELNQAIAEASTSGQEPSALMDQRDMAIDKLSKLIGVRVRNSSTGLNGVDIYVGSRALVRGGTTEAIEMKPDDSGVQWSYDGGSVAASGRIGGETDLITTTIPALRADLDTIAIGLRDTINAAHRDGFDRAGNAGLDFFTATSAADLAVAPLTRDQVAASAGGLASDGNNALAIASLRTAPAVGSQTAAGAVAALAGRLGNLAAGATARAENARAALASVDSQRISTNSVSLDEEMADLVRFQRAYEAAARVISVVDQTLDTLINRTGLG